MNLPARMTSAEITETVIAKGDISKLTPQERNVYYSEVCKSVGLNPLTRPLEYLTLQGKMVLYARRDAADQLRKLHGISIEIISQEFVDGLFSVHVRAKDKEGRTDEDLGVVAMPDTAKGEIRANTILKAITKAKRRVTLSISGLGFLDETEVEDIPAAAKQPVEDQNVPRETKVRAPSPSQVKTKEAVQNPFRASGADQNLWSADLERIIKEAKSAEDLTQIDRVNSDALERLNLKFPDLYKKLYAIFVARGKSLSKAKEDPISSGLSIRYSSDPAEYKKTIIDLMDSAKDYESLETIYNSNVDPIEEQMHRQDIEDLLGAFRRNENRLSP